MATILERADRRMKIRALTVVDTLSRLLPAIGIRQGYGGHHFVARRSSVGSGPVRLSQDYPACRSASARSSICGPYLKGATLHFSRPCKPIDDAFIGSFSGKSRTECLSANWVLSLDEARAKCEAWRRDYNEVRPHGAIGNRTPMELQMAASPASSTSEEARNF